MFECMREHDVEHLMTSCSDDFSKKASELPLSNDGVSRRRLFEDAPHEGTSFQELKTTKSIRNDDSEIC